MSSLAGRIDYFCDFISTALPQIEAKTVKPIATLTPERTAMLPDLPTADEQGLAGFDASGWYAMFAPKGTPDDVIAKLNAAVRQALADPTVKARLADVGQEIVPLDQQTPAALGAFQQAEKDKWWPIVKAAGLKGE